MFVYKTKYVFMFTCQQVLLFFIAQFNTHKDVILLANK